MMAAAMVVMTLGGCATPPPPDVQALAARVPAPASWQAALPASGGTNSPAHPDVEISVMDPELPRLLAAAKAVSPTLASASARIRRSQAQRDAADAAMRPLAQGSVSLQSGRPGGDAPRTTTTSVGVQAAWELDLFGGREADARAASANLVAAMAQRDAAHLALAAEVSTNLVALRACVAQRELASADSASRAEVARLTMLRERAGFSAAADAELARASAAQANSVWLVRQAACELQLKGLVELTGLAEQALRKDVLERDVGVPVGRRIDVTQLPAQLLGRRPDLAEAAAVVNASAATQDAARAALLPRVTFSGFIAAASSRQISGTSQGGTWSFGPLQIDVPLFDSGARRANVAAARADHDAAVANLQALVRRAVREVEQALVSLRSAQERDVDTRHAAASYEAVLRATQARQRAGLASLLELEDVRRSAIAAKGAVIELQREQTQAWIDLSRALGSDVSRSTTE